MFYKKFTNMKIKFFKKLYTSCWIEKVHNKYVILLSKNNFFHIKT